MRRISASVAGLLVVALALAATPSRPSADGQAAVTGAVTDTRGRGIAAWSCS